MNGLDDRGHRATFIRSVTWAVLRGRLLIVALVLLAPLFASPEWVERYYGRGLYPSLASLLVPLGDLAPFSLTGLLLVLLPLAVVGLMLRTWRRGNVRRWAGSLGVALVFGYALFLFSWGLNYGRIPLERKLELGVSPASPEEVLAFSRQLSTVVHEALPEVRDRERALSSIRQSLKEVVALWEGHEPTLPNRIKTFPPGLLLLSNAAGLASPFLLEAHVDSALPDYKFIAVAAHELGHVAGYAGEAEADFVAAVAGLRAEDPFARYALALSLLESVAWRLSVERRDNLVKTLPAEALADLEAMRDVLDKYRSPVRELQTWLYDVYLRFQGIEVGVADYGRVVDMLIAAERQGLSVTEISYQLRKYHR